jgi:L-ribulokinase
MALVKGDAFVLGLDYGTDSCRAVLIDAADGSEAAIAVKNYSRWKRGLYCNAALNQFRQHPQDYLEALIGTVKETVSRARSAAGRIKGIAIDTTGSTPCAVDASGSPLALKAEFAENPSAMFVLWKDHSALEEAAEINRLSRSWETDFTRFEGGIYSSEWYWAKIMRVFREDPRVAENAASFLEHCDWMTMLLTGQNLSEVRRSRCAMGHKAMWHRSFEGSYPSADFLSRLHPGLVKIRESLGSETYTSDKPAGLLSKDWASTLGLPAGIPVAVGAYDAHMGAVGGGIKPRWLVKVMGTSTCDMIVGPVSAAEMEKPVRGICGQVDGSIVPGMTGYEAGQSSFGDVYAWFRQLLMWPLETILPALEGIDEAVKEKLRNEIGKKILPRLEKDGASLNPAGTGIVALDWLNGRRTPDANQRLKSALTGLSLGSDAVGIYRALAESTAFGARAIVERFREEGVAIEGIIGIGGVARKSPFVMQIIADVLDMPIHVPSGDQSVALGAAMFASVAAGLYPDIPAAQKALCSPIEKIYSPNQESAAMYGELYRRYKSLGAFAETSDG